MEKALAVVIITDRIRKDRWSAKDVSSEFDELLRSARILPAERIICNSKKVSPSFLLGRGKIDEIRSIADGLDADVVAFSENLSGTQQKNIEDRLGVKTIDRTQLILDIFARRARSSEGKVQVELAQLEYLFGRLAGRGTELSRLGGGIGTRGPGEQKLEVDRRRIRSRITKLKRDLDSLMRQRSTRRKKRKHFSLLKIAIVGYTNAGKSTLMNRLASSNILVDNMLFCTLDPTIRKFTLPNNQNVLLVDTVGFIYRLPHSLIEAFKATLEEAVEADILLHVLDMSSPRIREHSDATYSVLEELKIDGKPIITALNKKDKIKDAATVKMLCREFKDAITISALNGENIEELVDRITLHLGRLTALVKLEIPRNEMKLLHLIYSHGKVTKRIDGPTGIYVEAQVPREIAERIGLVLSG